MKIVVYVEGEGDRACLETLLRPLIDQAQTTGVLVAFVPMTRGDRKKELLTKAPLKAANAILNDPEIFVVILPDLYPPNKGFEHRTCDEMQAGVQRIFRNAVEKKTAWDSRLGKRFHAFCLIHDVEVLLLASEESLLQDRRIPKPTWRKPVEDQNHEDPPKRVVERLFVTNYQATTDLGFSRPHPIARLRTAVRTGLAVSWSSSSVSSRLSEHRLVTGAHSRTPQAPPHPR